MTIRDIIIKKAEVLGLDGFFIAHQAKAQNGGEWVISVNHMIKYLRGEKDMTTEKLDAVLQVLELDLIDKHPF